MASSVIAFQVNCYFHRRPSTSNTYKDHLKASISSSVKPLREALEKVSMLVKHSTANMLDSLVDSVFEFVDQPLLPSQSNFAPVDEVGQPVVISSIEGDIPLNFPQGVYIRNGGNPLFGGLKSAKSVFGKSNRIWVEAEGMLHALYLTKDDESKWNIHYNNRYIETETFKYEKQRNKPSLIPMIEGDSLAIIFSSLLNLIRVGRVDKCVSNTNVFEHSGKLYSVAENHLPLEIDISTLETLGNWELSEVWKRAFTSHPKKAPGTGELVIIGMNAVRPFYEYGVVSTDGTKLLHRADLKFMRCPLCHDFGVTEKYNVFMDFPLTIDITRLLKAGQLIKYDKDEYARIGVMPRYGDADSIKWFEVEPNCTFHTINCFEDGDDEVVVWGCRTLESALQGPGSTGPSREKFDASVRDGLLHDRPYEWRLNMQTGQVEEKYLTACIEPSMDFPFINENFTGLKSKFGYAHVIDPAGLAIGDNMPRFSGLAKLHFQHHYKISSLTKREIEDEIKVEYHMFEDKTFCTGATFIPKPGGLEEDDGWILTFVHNEHTNISQVIIIDAEKISSKPVVKITLPHRVPYGFHGAFVQV